MNSDMVYIALGSQDALKRVMDIYMPMVSRISYRILCDRPESDDAIMDFFETAFVYSVDMPGRYFKGNAVDFIDGNPMWKVDAYRLMNGEVELAATTRKPNVLIFILTFAAIAALLLLFSRRLPGRRR